jgi:hypothetical protein
MVAGLGMVVAGAGFFIALSGFSESRSRMKALLDALINIFGEQT